MEDLQSKITAAIEKSKKWAHTGWEMTFGDNGTKVSSMEDAEKLSNSFVFKIESVAYWNQANNAGQDAAMWGEKALKAYKQGNMNETADALYQAYYIEKFYEKYTKTWKDLAMQLMEKK